MRRELLPDEIPEHPLDTLQALDYQERYWDAVCDYWQAVAEYQRFLAVGGKPS